VARAAVPGRLNWLVATLAETREETATARTLVLDVPGFWEGYGYHDYGDPWREQRYQGD